MKNKKPTSDELLTAIRANCLDCCGGSRREVKNCKIDYCKLWPYRKREDRSHEDPDEIANQLSIYDVLDRDTLPKAQ